MNEHDLLNAFQNVDPAFLEECEQMKAAAEQTAQQKQSPEAVREITMKQNTLWNRLTGAAAVIAVFSIAASGFAAIRPNRGAVANQPAETAMTETGETAPAAENAASTAPAEDSAQDIPATTVTALPLPSDEFVEATLPPPRSESDDSKYISEVSYSCILRKADAYSLKDYELGEAGKPEQYLLRAHIGIVYHYNHEETESEAAGADAYTARIVMIQDGELLPFALSETDEPALWKEVQVDEYCTVSQSVWLAANHNREYSTLSAVVTLIPEYDPTEPDIEDSDLFRYIAMRQSLVGSCVLHAADAREIVPAEQPYALAADTDYIDFPDINEKNGSMSGIEVGRKMDYESNVANKYEISTNDWQGETVLPRDALYLKLHLSREELESLSEFGFTSYMDGAYLIVLCDGKPVPVFDGKYVLRIDTPDPAKVLNYHLTPDDSVTSGKHCFTPVLIGAWNAPIDPENGRIYVNNWSSYLTVE